MTGIHMKNLYEKLGLFYLGSSVQNGELTLLKNRNLTTHAAIIGMTGSGKTGLAVAMIEEAMIDNIPVIIIDPKGDMGNLCLRSKRYEAKDFIPWVGEAKAEATAALWKKGIEEAHQDTGRSERLSETPVSIYTPGSSAGLGVNILASLDTPDETTMNSTDLFASYLNATVTSLLSLIGEADNATIITFLSTLIADFWQKGEALRLESLIGAIINPPFDKIGFLPLEGYFASKARFALASQFNSVVANPAFAPWLEGEALDIDALLFDANAKAKVSIFSISHLDDAQRMFFVTILLNRYVSWMRRQSGTQALRALLYMDEIYGYFPPSKNPPSKTPMMLLLKQARAFGVGVVLSTQNPVDLDYKALGNIGTWFIGRLQTRQDIDKVLEGLSGKLGAESSKEKIRQQLSNLEKRTFFLKSAHREGIERFSTRWVLSYLKGPLGRNDISALMASQKAKPEMTAPIATPKKSLHVRSESYALEFIQYYEALGASHYEPLLLLKASIYYHNAAKGIDTTHLFEGELLLDEADAIDFEAIVPTDTASKRYPSEAPNDATFAPLPALLLERDSAKTLQKALIEHLYNRHTLEMYRVRSPRFDSQADETLDAFKRRFKLHLNTLKAKEIGTLETRFQKRLDQLESQIERAEAKLEKEQSDVSAKTTDTLLSAGMAVLGTFFGSRATRGYGTTARKGSRLLKEKRDVTHAEEALEALEEKTQLLQDELEAAIDALEVEFALENYRIEPYSIRPKKRDISVESIALLWRGDMR